MIPDHAWVNSSVLQNVPGGLCCMSEVVSEILGDYPTILPHWRSARSSGSVEVTETFVSLKHCWWLRKVLKSHLVLFDTSATLLPASKQPIARWRWWSIIQASLNSISKGVFKIASRCPFQRYVTRPSQSKFTEIICVFPIYGITLPLPWKGLIRRKPHSYCLDKCRRW